jgi:hypothetical protein
VLVWPFPLAIRLAEVFAVVESATAVNSPPTYAYVVESAAIAESVPEMPE